MHYLALLLSRLSTSSTSPPSLTSSSTSSLSAASTTTKEISVLELGCGHGRPVTQHLLSVGYTVVANDLSSTQISLARANLSPSLPVGQEKRLELVQGDMLALEFEEGRFDAVVGMYSIIHLPAGEQLVLLRQIHSWLKSGGWLLANFGINEELKGGRAVEGWLDGHGDGQREKGNPEGVEKGKDEGGKGGKGKEEGWMYWSGFGGKGATLEKIREVGFEVVLEEETDEDGAGFVWVIGRKKD